MQTVCLNNYKAVLKDCESKYLRFGTAESYGIEKLKIIFGIGWDNLTVTATFVTPNSKTKVVVPKDGTIDVPPEATKSPLTLNNSGKIVFAGIADGVQRITTDVDFVVAEHSSIDGDNSNPPTPSEFEQFVSQVKDDADRADAAAERAESAAERAEKASEGIAASAEQAAQSATEAAQSAKDAAAELGKVQNAGTEAVKGIETAKQSALTDISSAKTGAVSDVTGAGTTQTGKVQDAGAAALTAIGTAQTTAVGAVQAAQTAATNAVQNAQQTATKAVEQAGTAQTSAVNAAGQAQQTAIQQAGQTAVGEVQQAQETGVQAVQNAQTEAEQAITALMPDVYTKAESDARYAPIEAAIKVSGKGTGLVSLSPTVGWYQQGLALYGRAWQDGTPSVENEVPIQDAGQSGTVDVTVCGANLFGAGKNGEQGYISNTDGSVTSAQNIWATNFIPVGNKSKVYFKEFLFNSEDSNNYAYRIGMYNSDRSWIKNFGAQNFVAAGYALTLEAGCKFIRISAPVAGKEFQVSFDPINLYTPYQSQQLPIPTPDGLPGIPVNSGGNWTDENGQQWVSDVVDLAAGTKISRIKELEINGTNNISNPRQTNESYYGCEFSTATQLVGYISGAMSDKLSFAGTNYNIDGDQFVIVASNGIIVFGFPKSLAPDGTKESVKAYLAEHPIKVIYVGDPITTPLDAETIAAYRALQSYPGTTNVLAPDAGIEASALADPNQWVQQQIQAAVTQAVSQAVALTGGNT